MPYIQQLNFLFPILSIPTILHFAIKLVERNAACNPAILIWSSKTLQSVSIVRVDSQGEIIRQAGTIFAVIVLIEDFGQIYTFSAVASWTSLIRKL